LARTPGKNVIAFLSKGLEKIPLAAASSSTSVEVSQASRRSAPMRAPPNNKLKPLDEAVEMAKQSAARSPAPPAQTSRP
jgi:hypothetical protein